MKDDNRLNFKPVEIENIPQISRFMNMVDYKGNEFAAGTIFLWRNVFNLNVAFYNDNMFIKVMVKEPSYLFPIGSGDIKENMELIENDALINHQPFRMHSLNEELQNKITNIWPNKYCFFYSRKDFDYIYKTQDLIELKGKKYHSKKNLVNSFKKTYKERYLYKQITKNNLHECVAINNEWIKKSSATKNISKQNEQSALNEAFKNYFDLNLQGGILTVDNKPISFTIGEKLNSDTFLIHFEKALVDYKGVYQMINYSFLKNNCSQYEYINREDDTGSFGLRKAKLSYKPIFLEKKLLLRKKDELTEIEKNRLEMLNDE